MKQRSSLVWFVLSLLFALGAAMAANAFIRSVAAGVPVVVAAKALDPMEPITPDAVKVETRPKAGLPSDAIRNLSDAVGKFARTGLVPGMVLQRSMLAGDASEGITGLDARLSDISKDTPLRAFPLKLTEAQGYSLVRVGHRVDVLAAVKTGAGTVSGVVVANVPVLAKIDKAQDQGTIGVPGSGPQPNRPAPEGIVVLALTPQDAARVALAAQLGGQVVLMLRPAGEPADRGGTPVLGEDGLFNRAQPQPQAAPPQGGP